MPHTTIGRNGGQHLQGMVLLSFLLHALFLSIFLLSPTFPAKKWTFGPVYSVDLVSLPAGAVETKPTASISKELSSPGSRQEDLNLKKQDENRPIPLLKQNAPKTDNTDREKAIENLKKRVASSPPASARTPAAPQSQVQPAAQGQGTAADPQVITYYSRLKARVMSQWALPAGILPQHNLRAVLNVIILRDGSLARVTFERRSGNRLYDESAERAVRKANPFPPFPEAIKGASLEVEVRFPG